MNVFLRHLFILLFLVWFVFDGGMFAAGFVQIPFFSPIWATLTTTPQLIVALTIVQITILSVYAHYVYVAPIRLLKREIAMFLTGMKSDGATVTNPLNPDVRFIANFFSKSLEILKNFKEEFKTGRVLRSEVELASEIQKHVLKKRTVTIPSIDIVADTKSATEVGWDSYDIIAHGDNYYVYLGDVTGHGVASGFVMMIVNALISGFVKIVESSADILAKTNEIVKPRVKSNMLMTLLMIRWNERDKKMYMTGAGHEYLLVYKASQNKTYKIKSGGVALGMARDISKILKETQIGVEVGDIIVMYTDGITESRNGKRESDLMFGIDRLVSTIDTAPEKTAQGVFNTITIELSKFMGYNHRQFDDITLIVMHYRGNKPVESTAPTALPEEMITEWSWQHA